MIDVYMPHRCDVSIEDTTRALYLKERDKRIKAEEDASIMTTLFTLNSIVLIVLTILLITFR